MCYHLIINMDSRKTISRAEPKPVNYVHSQTIHRENIQAERKFEGKNLKYEYTFSPYTCIYIQIYNFFSLSHCRKADKHSSFKTIHFKNYFNKSSKKRIQS